MVNTQANKGRVTDEVEMVRVPFSSRLGQGQLAIPAKQSGAPDKLAQRPIDTLGIERTRLGSHGFEV